MNHEIHFSFITLSLVDFYSLFISLVDGGLLLLSNVAIVNNIRNKLASPA